MSMVSLSTVYSELASEIFVTETFLLDFHLLFSRRIGSLGCAMNKCQQGRSQAPGYTGHGLGRGT
jgi:hypothetical protein